MAVITHIIINCLIFFTHLELAHKWLKPRERSMTEIIVAAALSANAQIIVVIMILGRLFETLRVPQLFWVNAGLCIVFLLVAKWRPRDARRLFSDIGQWMRTGYITVKGDAVLTVLIIIVVLVFLWLLFLAILLPPYSWDGLAYHLTMMGLWLQDGRIDEHMDSKHYILQTWPINAELLFFWNTVFFRNDTIVNCTQLFFVPLGMMSIYLMARRTGRRRRTSMLAGILFLTFPIVIQQATCCMIDIIFSVLFLASLAFLIKPRIEFSDVVYAALGLGLFFGSKGSSAYFILAAVGSAFIYHLPHIVKRVKIVRFAGWLLAGLFFFLLAGSWQYAKNWAVFGNPVHPYNVEVFGKTIFKGTMDIKLHQGGDLLKGWKDKMEHRSTLGQVYFSWTEPGEMYMYDSRVGGWGAAFFILLLPCLGAALLISLVRRDGRTFFTLLIILLSFWATPVGKFWVRYSIFLVSAFVISLAYLLDLLRTSRASHLLKGSLLLLVIPTLFLGARGNDYILPSSVLKSYLSLPFEKWHSSHFVSGGWERSVFNKINDVTQPGTIIAHDRHYTYLFKYPLWNRDFSNKVYYIKGEKGEGENWEKVLDDWEAAVDKWDIDFWISGKDSQTSQRARMKPGKFRLLIEGGYLALFEVIKGKETEVDDET